MNLSYEILLGLLADIRAAVGDPDGKLMQDELVEHIRAIYDLGEAHERACRAWESAMMAAVGEDGVNDVVGKIADMRHRISMQDAELFTQAIVVVNLRSSIETMQREAIRAGAQRAEVFAMVPVGQARRGAEWSPS